jgi:hypothetical protein
MMIFLLLAMSGCTLSLENISTHGTATDLGDQALSTDPQVQVEPKPATAKPTTPVSK